MTDADYLDAVLRDQTLVPGGPELTELHRQREHVESVIAQKLGHACPTVRWGGSKAKNTMIKDAYDLDLPTYFDCDERGAGESLEEIYNTVADAMVDDYYIERRRSAIRLRKKDPERFQEDTHIDLVPGRFFDESKSDVWLYQHAAEKCRMKTNPDVHIEHIRDSGVRPAIRLGKLWNVREGVRMKTFVLELAIVEILKFRKTAALSAQFRHVLEEFRDNVDNLIVVDPANGNNDLTAALSAVKPLLVFAAGNTLTKLESEGWQGVSGELKDENRAKVALRAAAAVPEAARYKPWCGGQ